MDVVELLKRSDAELKQWVASQDRASLAGVLESAGAEIRSARLTSGAPRSLSSQTCVDLARAALRVAEWSEDNALIVEGSRLVAYSLNADEQYTNSLPYYASAIAGLESLGDHALANRNRIGYVSALFHSGKYEEALNVADVAENWLRNNNDEVGLARLCNNVANLYNRLDEHEPAYRYHLIAAQTFEKLGDQQSLAQSYHNLGMVGSFLDKFETSDEMLEKCEQLSQSLGHTELWAQASYNRAYLHFLRGRYSHALQGFSRLRLLFEKAGSKRYYALCDLDEAEIYDQLNLAKDAVTLAQRALEQFKELGMVYEQAKAGSFLGVALTQLHRYSDALEVFQAAQKQFELEGNAYRMAVLDLYRAEVHIALKRLWEARSCATSARDRFARMAIPSKRILSLVVLGRVSLELKDLAAAEACAEEIRQLIEQTKVPLLLFPYYLLQGDIAERNNRHSDAERHYEAAAEDLEMHQTRLHHDDLRVTFFSGRNRAYEELVLLKIGRSDDTSSIADAYAWCERAKSRGLIELLTHHLPSVQGQTQQPLLTKINRLREELNMLYVRSQPEVRPVPSLSNVESISNKENELARTLREVSHSDPEYASLQQVTTATIESIQAILPADTTIVEYFVARGEVLAFVISPNDVSVERHLCPVSRVADIHERLGFQLEKFQLGSEYVDAHSDQIRIATERHLNELHQILIRRFRGRLKTRKLVVIPHGILHLLPFHALFDGAEYLIDSHEISYAPSASVLKYCLEKKDFSYDVPVLVGVADAQAPYVEDEIRNLSRICQNPKVLLNEAATRSAFISEAAEASFLHIATHAIFRHDNPMFSGFKLYDGWMTAFDLFSMNCRTNLVTLSGCKSGISQVTGSDDLVGLMRGFLYSGARSLMVSLWNVDDKTTSELMARFYNFWRDGHSRAEGLAKAMKAIRQDHPNPFYWAPFLMVGKGE